ncbi:TadE family type IV pilus minor pilin [Bifidobacterium sp. ESL0763]|uniref:TadE family type IV pilus minor pilin n=1 Tax=Bifidobacterium sp. ESL0763 TaxID=2983227 RepID=UPI0023F91816|nr:TadE family type IV pilus minor pilin [Bifidobacterium sp. ESL0763]MDF7664324.1 TadE family type IV pilus minor pilin [Bifidobacterium sp. ESL0763]
MRWICHGVRRLAGKARAAVRGEDRGAVTAEFAMVLPAVVAIAALLLMLARAVTVEMNCQDAASAGARVAVTTKDNGRARAAAIEAADHGAQVSVSRGVGKVDVVVSCPVVPDPMHVLPTHVTGKATGLLQ